MERYVATNKGAKAKFLPFSYENGRYENFSSSEINFLVGSLVVCFDCKKKSKQKPGGSWKCNV